MYLRVSSAFDVVYYNVEILWSSLIGLKNIFAVKNGMPKKLQPPTTL